jgi:hypothetical protein
MSAMLHAARCGCSECGKLDRKHPREGHQLAMFEGREQRPPTEAEALAALFELAGKGAACERSGQRRLMI